MSNEKTSEGAGWRDRLGQLDALPDTDGAWREGAWEKLYNRLQQKEDQPPRRMGWYWAAAACLVMVVAVSLLPGKTVRPGRPGQPGHTAASGQPHPPVIGLKEQASVIYSTDSPKMENNRQSPGKDVASRHESRKDESRKKEPEVIHPIGLTAGQLQKQPVPGPGDLQQPVGSTAGAQQSSIFPDNRERHSLLTDSTVLAATAPPILPVAQRKLRVVHINELGMPIPEDSPSSHMAGNFFLRIHLFNSDAAPNQLMGSNNEINLNQTFRISFKN